jgi:hypothetical protein
LDLPETKERKKKKRMANKKLTIVYVKIELSVNGHDRVDIG